MLPDVHMAEHNAAVPIMKQSLHGPQSLLVDSLNHLFMTLEVSLVSCIFHPLTYLSIISHHGGRSSSCTVAIADGT